ncbi:MAG: hypothetical protein A2729_01330 [Candidatus Buchananbacteria bacterium RIFCSPHIGHO2_01_FULL_39_14]|uniref:Thioester reductase (TE) domain-containing protein n=2 Tax=Candidatus Buchananiibacteriota TaxID=1817903 RepID=A0A1G1YU26_9BACT|nr:MAG: hypothetical protein A2729_01330 [Candidatus Buchananbacteria bacterium RIFCSPHIGHO2_01_FULL_39_14]OGY49206.1 MAG: hypothetical protein A3D39_00355 [Candidatus Buchananbacteria bacterium RIFCSPHIGHO2_02_FULL_39_17]OGY55868.1 MAG: hypothetical protein A2912_02690 [Candidatus Buchananbacteria bacterium RIFCSPLOWO2_01_FULL_40_23b]
MKILLTGATGTLGSELVKLLHKNNHKLYCLIRPKKNFEAQERLSVIIGNKDNRVIVISGDITELDSGISNYDLQLINNNVDIVIHAAASIKFDQEFADEIEKINIYGTKNIISLSKKIKAKSFHYISTAYVAGDATIFNENDFEMNQIFRNPYERTKKEAEALVRKEFNKSFTIYRPSILVGNFYNGQISSFDGFYGFLKVFWRLKQKIESLNSIQKKMIENICRIDEDDKLFFPININCSSTSTLNLVPLDWVANNIVNLIEYPATGQVFHLVNDSPPKVKFVFEYALKKLGIKGVNLGDNVKTTKLPKEFDILNRIFNIYSPYIIHESIFGAYNLKKVLNYKYRASPAVEEEYLSRLISYAIKVDFRDKSF